MRSQRSRPDEWELLRAEITDLFAQGMTQSEIQQTLAKTHGFDKTIKQLEYRMGLWGLRKNLTQSEYQYIGQSLSERSKEDKSNATVLLNNHPIPPKKLHRGIQRYRRSSDPGSRPRASEPGKANTPEGIAIVSPPGSPGRAAVPAVQSPGMGSADTVIRSTEKDAASDTTLGGDISRQDTSALPTGSASMMNSDDRPTSIIVRPESRKRKWALESYDESEKGRDAALRKGATDIFRYACPFAKSDPGRYRSCVMIGRQNISGVKEHLKRKHFRGILPDNIRTAKTWKDVFDCACLDWDKRRPRPSPYLFFSHSGSEGRAESPDETVIESGQHRLTSGLSLSTRNEASHETLLNLLFSDVDSLQRTPSPITTSDPSPPGNMSFNPLSRAAAEHTNYASISNPIPTHPPHLYNKKVRKKCLLMVTRNPQIPESREKRGVKRFYFDDFDEFHNSFESWLRLQFTDPPFSWDRCSLLNGLTQERLSDLESVADMLEFIFVAHRSTDAALYLVMREDAGSK